MFPPPVFIPVWDMLAQGELFPRRFNTLLHYIGCRASAVGDRGTTIHRMTTGQQGFWLLMMLLPWQTVNESNTAKCRQLLLCWGLSFRRHLLLKVLGCRASPPIGPRDTRTSPRRALVEADRSCCGGDFFLGTETEATQSLLLYRSVGCGTVAQKEYLILVCELINLS